MDDLTLPETDAERHPLFTPSFGSEPYLSVGHDQLSRLLYDGLAAGPSSLGYTSVLMGPRGLGKTVMLNKCRNLAERAGWIAVSVDASTPGLIERIHEEVEEFLERADSVPSLPQGREDRTAMSVGIAPFGWRKEVIQKVRPRWSFRRLFTTLAEHAANHNSGVLLLVDELHAGVRDELRRVGADIQHVTKNNGLPLAFIGAGLSEMKHTVMEDRRLTFFHRCRQLDMPVLHSSHITEFFITVVREGGGSFERGALECMTEGAGSHPFQMQLVGDLVWRFSGAPKHPITVESAEAGVREAQQITHQQLVSPTWNLLDQSEKNVMSALAAGGGTATRTEIAHQSRDTASTIAEVERRLIHKGCVEMSDGTIRLTGLFDAGNVRELHNRFQEYETAIESLNPTSRFARCNAYMPRSRAKCVLSEGHAGRCRSK